MLYAGLHRISTTIREGAFGSVVIAGGVNEVVSDLVLWEPKHGKRSLGGLVRRVNFRSAGGGHLGPQRLLACRQ